MTHHSPGQLLRFAIGSLLLLACAATQSEGLSGRLIAGYQGWFGCPGDFLGNRQWHHWFAGPAALDSLTVDSLPSLKTFRPEDLCDTGLASHDGTPVKVFSSQNPNIVDRHFEWLKANDIDGVAFQRFVSHTRDPVLRKRSDNVLNNVRNSAESSGRIFYLTYDVSGADSATVIQDIRSDWKYLVNQLKMTQSPAYLTQAGSPVVGLWGFGFKDRPGNAKDAGELIADLKNGNADLTPAFVVGGVPAGWRTLSSDSKSEAEWARVYRSYDFLSPWAVGRFRDEPGADNFRRTYVEPDLAETRKLGIGYMPVLFPGFSWHNLMTNRGQPAKAILNQIPRRCGKFMWRQVVNALEAGADSIYAAMFDEVDEGTALFSLQVDGDRAPVGAKLVSLDQDGCSLPEDWYLRITGKAAQLLRDRKAPEKVLEDALKP